MCGEETIPCVNSSPFRGTPPRVWGRVVRFNWRVEGRRDTPTCVGKRIRLSRSSCQGQGHPHVCGEESKDQKNRLKSVGTPPRVWGRVVDFVQGSAGRRDTPTCVGKRIIMHKKVAKEKGHPHVCGEETKENDMQPTLK